jgi:Flp pilus assembly protein TadG
LEQCAVAILHKLIARVRRLPSFERLAGSDDGATAVEFGLIAAPFLALLVGLLQTAVVFLAGRELDEAVATASRYIMTGQAQNSNMTQAQFNNWVCQNIYALFNCNNLMVNVQTYSSFSSATTAAPTLTFNTQGQVTNSWSYAPGGPGDIVVVQVMYQWPVVLAPLGFNLSNLANGNRLLMSTAVFRNEPY